MPLYRVQVRAAADNLFPRDMFVNTLHFDDEGIGTDADGLCEDIANAFKTGWYNGTAQRQITAAAYIVGQTGGSVGFWQIDQDQAPVSGAPREVALCLSYYSETNTPRRRGRLFLPLAGAATSPGLRPPDSIMTKALSLGDALAGIGGADVDWVVYSPTTGDHWDVTNTWVDDEWDTIRSRGLRATKRITGTPGS